MRIVTWAVRIAIWAIVFGASAAVASPEKAAPRVIFHTIGGDLVFALYSKVAAKTVEQFLALNRNGVYDTGHFRRLEPGFVLQTGTANDRIIPLNAAQRELIHKLPGEYAPEVRHKRGVLSLARPDDDPNGGGTSFSILLGDAPHLDGKYTVFGELESGADVLEALERVPVTNGRPALRLTISSAEVAETPEALRGKVLRRALPLAIGFPGAGRPLSFSSWSDWKGLPVIFGLLALTTMAAAFWGRGLRPVLFLNALIGGFALFLYLTPFSAGRPWLAGAILLGVAVLFRAMSMFESPPRHPSKAP
jgi:cyclophilin family peptidyl-prolyl cis-trans isomerase